MVSIYATSTSGNIPLREDWFLFENTLKDLYVWCMCEGNFIQIF